MKRIFACLFSILLLLCACAPATQPDAPPLESFSFEDLLSGPIEALSGDALKEALQSGGWELVEDPVGGSFYAGTAMSHAARLTFTTDQKGFVSSVTLQTIFVPASVSIPEDARGYVSFDGSGEALMASCIMQSRFAMQAAGGALTGGARYFSGESEQEIRQVISAFFEENPDASAEFAEQHYLLPTGDYFGSSVVGSSDARPASTQTVRFICHLYAPDYHDSWGAQPQYADYQIGNSAGSYVDAPLMVTR